MDIHSVSREAKTCVLDRASTQVFRFAQDDYVATSGLIRATLRGAPPLDASRRVNGILFKNHNLYQMA